MPGPFLHAPWLLLALAGACGFGLEFKNPEPEQVVDTAPGDADSDSDGDSDGDSDTDTDTDADEEIVIGAVVPDYGTTAGGETVTIEASPLDSSAVVRFGSNTAGIQSVSSDEVVVTVPATSSEGAVDILITTNSGSGQAEGAFTYFLDGTGLAGAIGILAWYHYLGTYWEPPPPADFGFGWVTFTVPADFYLWDWYAPGTDNCYNGDYPGGGKIYVYPMDVAAISLTSGAADIAMPWSETDLEFADDEILSAQFIQNATYDLQPVVATDFPPFEVPGFLRTPGSFTISSPSIAGSEAIGLARNALAFRWSGSGGDVMLLQLGMFNSTGDDWDQWVTCVLEDDGEFTVPSSAWTAWPTPRQVTVWLSRWVQGTATLPYNDADSRVVGSYGVIGAFFTQ